MGGEPVPNFSGIYAIRCVTNGRVYVGSAVWIAKRWRHHRESLRNGAHHNQHLQRAWVKYGDDAFTFEVLERCEREELVAREQHYIDSMRACEDEFGFNILPNARSRVGFRMSPEQRARHAEAMKRRGYVPTDETRRRISEFHKGNKWNLGNKHTPESIAKMRVSAARPRRSHKKNFSAAALAATSARFRGVPLRDEHKRKIADALSGKPKTDIHRMRLGLAQRRYNDAEVAEIRAMSTSGLSYRLIGRRFGCSSAVICNIVNRRRAYG